MNIVVGASCLLGIAVVAAMARASPEGEYLVNHYGFTCSGFLAAADAKDPVRLHTYTDTINRLASQKWGSLSNDRLRQVILAIVEQCQSRGRADFESTARQVIARSGP